MKKKEVIIREILFDTLEKKDAKITQLELASRLDVSTSTVNNAIKPLVRLGAIDVKSRGLNVIDVKKALIYLASIRNLQRDIIYQTYIPKGVLEIEKSMPAGILYGLFSAYKFQYDEVPADYSEVYIYSKEEDFEKIKRRFPEMKGPPNLFILRADPALFNISNKNIVPSIQIYIDLWNTRQWYAKEFLIALEKKMNL